MTKANTRPQSQNTREGKVVGNVRPTPKLGKITKNARLISLLSKKPGSDVANISKKFGWLPHTIRAALSRLRKAGYQISSIKPGNGKPSKYHITDVPSEHLAQ